MTVLVKVNAHRHFVQLHPHTLLLPLSFHCFVQATAPTFAPCQLPTELKRTKRRRRRRRRAVAPAKSSIAYNGQHSCEQWCSCRGCLHIAGRSSERDRQTQWRRRQRLQPPYHSHNHYGQLRCRLKSRCQNGRRSTCGCSRQSIQAYALLFACYLLTAFVSLSPQLLLRLSHYSFQRDCGSDSSTVQAL